MPSLNRITLGSECLSSVESDAILNRITLGSEWIS